jgi:hypothetical protein
MRARARKYTQGERNFFFVFSLLPAAVQAREFSETCGAAGRSMGKWDNEEE